MEMREGYKQTEFGLIPNDWNFTPINDLYDFQGGSQPPRHTFIFEEKAGYIRLLQIRDYKTDKYASYIPESLAKRHCKADDIMIGRYGPPIFQILNGLEGAYNVALIKAIPTERINKKYGWFILKQEKLFEFVEKLSQRSSGQTGVALNELKNYLIPLPPTKAEQTAIATALSDADALITSLEKLIEKKRAIKQGAIQELLRPKEGWEVKKLGEVADITKLAGFEYTNYFNSYNDGGEIVVVRGTNITHNKMDLTDVKYIPRSTSNKLQRSKLRKDDLVFAYVGTIGPAFLVDENDKYHLGPNTSKISSSFELSPLFLFHYFTSTLIKKEIIDNTSIGAQPSLSMFKIRSFNILLPPKDIQIHIAKILSNMDEEIASLEQKLLKCKLLKQGMMQELLTGKTRLV